jgi:hypothetical protein
MIENCRLNTDMQRTTQMGRDFLKSLRRLRRDLKKCRYCSAKGDCPFLTHWNAQIDAAVSEITTEWATS